MPGFLSLRKCMPLLLIPEYSGINKGQRVPDRSKTAHKKPFVKCFLTLCQAKNHQTDHHTDRTGISRKRILQMDNVPEFSNAGNINESVSS